MMIGERIKRLRKEKGYSISELAKLACVSKSYLSQIERGLQTNPSLQFLRKVATTLGTNIDFLLEKEGENVTTDFYLDKEWKELVQLAIRDGLSKEDFQSYCKYIKFESWKRTKR